MKGVMSNGLACPARSKVGSMTSVNCTKQLGHHDTTSPVRLVASLSMVLPAKRPDVSTSPARNCMTPQQCVGPPMTR